MDVTRILLALEADVIRGGNRQEATAIDVTPGNIMVFNSGFRRQYDDIVEKDGRDIPQTQGKSAQIDS